MSAGIPLCDKHGGSHPAPAAAAPEALAAALQENATLKAQFAQLRTLLDAATDANGQHRAETLQLVAQLERLQAALDAKCQEFDELLSSFRSLSSERSRSDEEVRSRLAEEVVVKAQLQQEIAELQEFRGVYLELKREMQRRENAYQVERDSKARELAEAVLHYEQRIHALETTQAEFHTHSESRSQRQQVATLQSEKEALERRVGALQDEVESLRGQHDELLVQQRDAGQRAAATAAELQRALQEALGEAARHREAAAAMTAARDAEAAECQRLHRELLAAQGDTAALRSQVETANLYFAAERQLLEQSGRERAAEHAQQRAQLEQRLLDCEKRCGLLESRCHRLVLEGAEAQRLAAAQVAQAREEAAAQAAAAERRLADTVGEFEAAVAQHDAAAATWQETIRSLQSEAQEAEAERSALKAALDEATAARDRLQHALDWQAAEHDAAVQQVAELLGRLQELSGRLQDTSELSTENERLRHQAAFSQRDAERLAEEATAARRELAEATLRLQRQAAEAEGRLRDTVAEKERVASRASKTIEKQKTTFSAQLLRAEQRYQRVAARCEEAETQWRGTEQQLGQALRALHRLRTATPSPPASATADPPTVPGAPPPPPANWPAGPGQGEAAAPVEVDGLLEGVLAQARQ
eukprot:EG_transcript_5799